ncbi:MAG: RNA polymerase sigma factor, partial [Angustibacter sp.]
MGIAPHIVEPQSGPIRVGPVDPPDLTVEVLLCQAAQGQAAAWDELVRRFERLVWSIARSYRLTPADAGDAVQTTWLRLVEHLGGIKEPERLGAWLATTTRRESLRIVSRRRRERGDLADEHLIRLPADGPAVEDALLARERD